MRQKNMQLPFRTNSTWLDDGQLILLDVMFDGGAPFRLLRDKVFRPQWNLAYSHGLDDGQLESASCQGFAQASVAWQQESNTATIKWFLLAGTTLAGSALVCAERCPVWERYCYDRYRYPAAPRERTLMSVVAVSPNVRDHFLDLWPPRQARRRTAVIRNHRLIRWHPFEQLFVGLATYDERELMNAEGNAWDEWRRWQRAKLQEERSWWRRVPELQRFVR